MVYQLEKSIWMDEDFDLMGWHDATIWSVVPDPDAAEFSLDLDYIFQWVHPAPDETYFKFQVAPVTMVFHAVTSMSISVATGFGPIEVDDLIRGEADPAWGGQRRYQFLCHEGEVSVTAERFTMHVRRQPRLSSNGQRFTLAERGGISFARPAQAD